MRKSHLHLWVAALILACSVLMITGSTSRSLYAAKPDAPERVLIALTSTSEPAPAPGADRITRQEPVWITANKQVSDTEVPLGATLIYTLSFNNVSAVSFPVTITDVLSPSLSLVSAWSSYGHLNYGANVITYTGILSSEVSLVIGFQAQVLAPGIIKNSARVDAGSYGQYSTPVVMTTAKPHIVYLPSVMDLRPAPGIHGKLTFNGDPQGNYIVELRFFNGASWSTRAYAQPSWYSGKFMFRDVPALEPGQLYYVLYRRPTSWSPGLLLWATRTLTTYNEGDGVYIGTFDIADVPLLSPGNEAAVYFPVTFRWGPRGAVPSDIYEFNLFDPYDFDPALYAIVGYTGELTLHSLPLALNVGDLYAWYMGIYSPDGGYGIGSQVWAIYFENTGLRASPFSAQSQILGLIEAQKVQRR